MEEKKKDYDIELRMKELKEEVSWHFACPSYFGVVHIVLICQILKIF